MAPAEIFHVSNAVALRLRGRDRAEWERTRWLATKMVNISGKTLKFDLRPQQLIRFPDEIEKISPEDREARTKKILAFVQSKFFMKFKRNPDGTVKRFDQEDYDRLMKNKKRGNE